MTECESSAFHPTSRVFAFNLSMLGVRVEVYLEKGFPVNVWQSGSTTPEPFPGRKKVRTCCHLVSAPFPAHCLPWDVVGLNPLTYGETGRSSSQEPLFYRVHPHSGLWECVPSGQTHQDEPAHLVSDTRTRRNTWAQAGKPGSPRGSLDASWSLRSRN